MYVSLHICKCKRNIFYYILPGETLPVCRLASKNTFKESTSLLPLKHTIFVIYKRLLLKSPGIWNGLWNQTRNGMGN